MQLIFARALYDATLAPMLPVDAQTTFLTPNSLALVISTVDPRSLKLPVGFAASYLNKKFLL